MKHYTNTNQAVLLKCKSLLALAFTALLWSGCSAENKAKPEAAKPAESATTTAAAAPAAAPIPMPTMQPTPESDKAWAELQKALKAPARPDSWRTQEPSEEEIKKYNQEMAKFAAVGADLAKEFYTKHPNAPQSNSARRRERDLLTVAAEHQTNLVARLSELEKNYDQTPAGVEDKALKERFSKVQAAGYAMQGKSPEVMLDALVEGSLAIKKDFPYHEVPDQLLMQLIQMAEQNGAIEKTKVLVDAIVKGNAPEELKEHAQLMTLRYTFVGKEIGVKFKAVDGREVDLEKLRGKVVLIDFWASWCGPCMKEMPRLKDAYAKWHGKGLEVIGISLDKSEEAMNRALTRTELPWPIHFEGEGKDNQFARKFGIMPIPEFWLIDKKGILRNREARHNLESEIEKLLAEKDPS